MNPKNIRKDGQRKISRSLSLGEKSALDKDLLLLYVVQGEANYGKQ